MVVMAWHCRNKSDHYLALEDDVIAAKGYVEVIKKIIEKKGFTTGPQIKDENL